MPDWARRARLGLKLTTRSSSSGSSASDGRARWACRTWCPSATTWPSATDTLSPEELAELARLKVPLVRVRGQWVELDDRHLKAALKFLAGKRSGTMTAAEVLARRSARAGARRPGR